jgi:alkaline phosphatase
MFCFEVTMIKHLQYARTILLSLLIVFFSSVGLAGLAQAQPQTANGNAPKHVFVFLADGGGITHMGIARQYNRIVRNAGLVISDKIMAEGTLGLMATHATDSLTADSTAAATAVASGRKAKLGVLARPLRRRRPC